MVLGNNSFFKRFTKIGFKVLNDEDVLGIEVHMTKEPETFGILLHDYHIQIISENGYEESHDFSKDSSEIITTIEPCVLLGPLQTVKFWFGKPKAKLDQEAVLILAVDHPEDQDKNFPPQTFRRNKLLNQVLRPSQSQQQLL